MSTKRCVDCVAEGITTNRIAKHPGPRCNTHHLRVTRERKDRAHAQYVQRTYGITGEQYWEIFDYQGGKCSICTRANGKTRRLAVDHDHGCCPELPACGQCVRGLLCKLCNRDVLGHLRDDPEAFERGAAYLRNPPARAVLKRFTT